MYCGLGGYSSSNLELYSHLKWRYTTKSLKLAMQICLHDHCKSSTEADQHVARLFLRFSRCGSAYMITQLVRVYGSKPPVRYWFDSSSYLFASADWTCCTTCREIITVFRRCLVGYMQSVGRRFESCQSAMAVAQLVEQLTNHIHQQNAGLFGFMVFRRRFVGYMHMEPEVAGSSPVNHSSEWL